MSVKLPYIGDVSPTVLLVAGGAVLFALMNSREITKAIVVTTADTLNDALIGAAEGGVEVATTSGFLAPFVSSAEAMGETDAAQAVRGWFGFADYRTTDAKMECEKATRAGDDLTAAKYCNPNAWFYGLFDGR